MTLFDVAQLQIVVLGTVGITMISTSPRYALVGFVLGLFNLWAWIYSSVATEAWGVLGINIVYGVNYVRGLRNYWRHRHKPVPEEGPRVVP